MLTPLFRWAGSKTKMKSKYGEDIIPDTSFSRFVDPFFGTGCVSMWMPDNVDIIASDYNEDIINIYKNIQQDYKTFCDGVDQYQAQYIPLDKEGRRKLYFDTRHKHGWEYDNLTSQERAVMLFFLLKTSFNGFWQLNKNTNNKFGTPVGLANEKDTIYSRDDVKDFSDFAQRVTFLTGDFAGVINHVTDDSYVYLDPPYRDCFTNYSSDGFNDDDQSRLCDFMTKCNDIGAKVGMSNKYHFDDFFESRLPNNFNVLTYEVKYTAGRGAKDGEKVKVTECLIRNFKNSSMLDL